MGQQILKRACTLRSEMKIFLAYLDENKVEELAQELHNFVTYCVNNIENGDCVSDSTNISQIHFLDHRNQSKFRPHARSIVQLRLQAGILQHNRRCHNR